jgi:hypothetical protein
MSRKIQAEIREFRADVAVTSWRRRATRRAQPLYAGHLIAVWSAEALDAALEQNCRCVDWVTGSAPYADECRLGIASTAT